MQIVNGYVCECSDDARLAKRGIDPDNPHQDPAKQRELDQKHGKIDEDAATDIKDAGGARANFGVDAVLFGGALSGLSSDTTEAEDQQKHLVDFLA